MSDYDALIQGDVMVSWIELGEGISGDYDPDDEEDAELLRFDLHVRGVPAENNWVTHEDRGDGWCALCSLCTWAATKISDEERSAGLRLLMRILYDRAYEGVGLNAACDAASGIDVDDIRNFMKRERKQYDTV